jgi:hypothetical protein
VIEVRLAEACCCTTLGPRKSLVQARRLVALRSTAGASWHWKGMCAGARWSYQTFLERLDHWWGSGLMQAFVLSHARSAGGESQGTDDPSKRLHMQREIQPW